MKMSKIALIASTILGLSTGVTYADTSLNKVDVTIIALPNFKVYAADAPEALQAGASWTSPAACTGFVCHFEMQFPSISQVPSSNGYSYPISMVIGTNDQSVTCTFHLTYNNQLKLISKTGLNCSQQISYHVDANIFEYKTIYNNGSSVLVMQIISGQEGGIL